MVDAQWVIDTEKRHDSGVFNKRALPPIVKGQGARLWDATGREYLDFGANYGVMNVGHCHPRVVEAIERQARELMFIAQTYHNDQRAILLDKLLSTAPHPLTRAFLANSGTEAVEAALKFARGVTKRKNFVAMKKSFHGRTFGALSVTFKNDYREPFQPLIDGVSFASFGDEESLKQAVTRETAAVILEPVQGEGGVYVAPPGYLKAVQDIAHDAGALVIFDEIQTGFGRTGRFWACEHDGVTPDILCFAKSVAGGLPMGGVLLTEQAAKLPLGTHGNTFGGSPLVCAAASATIDVLRGEHLPERASQMGRRLVDGLRSVATDAVREVRGRGLMVGLELKGKNVPLLNGLVAEGVLTLPTGTTVVRYLPPLVVTEQQVDFAVAATAKALLQVPAA
ncbi:MAG TPA: aspartate aminotransferase family protein [Candidatus Thermoplasmatota archaeon]|nr:aspartate aminotransferase family protein [Candidatus Thermoplasmatota archaeon]